MTNRIAIVIPTRNRDELARNAVRSLLRQRVALDIFVSDNSPEAGGLAAFCRKKRVHYLRPPSELAMPQHWDWAVRQAMAISPASHFSVHYDRKYSKPFAWDQVAEAVNRRPDLLLTMMQDVILHVPPPLRLWQTQWTGKLYEIRTARVAELIASGTVRAIANVLPLLSNCVVPREILQGIIDRFGDLCGSHAPDSAFMTRFFALNDVYGHFDHPIAILYASTRSNGMGYMLGKGGDFADYLKIWGDRPWLDAAPIPGLNLGQNMLFHEYELIRRETGDRLPRIDTAGAIEEIGADLHWVDDPKVKNEIRELLRRHGWQGPEPEPLPGNPPGHDEYQRKVLFRARWLRRKPARITGFRFPDDETALRYGLKYGRRPDGDGSHLALVEPVEA